jgi:hypothetical protein
LDNPSIVTDKVVEALEQRDAIIGRIRAGLPAVKERSALNFSVIADVMSK